jgi:hypothetical protein
VRQRSGDVWWQGFVTGLIGYAVVAVAYATLDLLTGRSALHTAALLGHALLGTDAPSAVGMTTPGPVFAYNGVHLLLFLGFGITASWLVEEVERHPLMWYLVFFAFLVGFMYNVLLVTLFTLPAPVGERFWITIVGANVLAGTGMGWYLARSHPSLPDEIETGGDPEGA